MGMSNRQRPRMMTKPRARCRWCRSTNVAQKTDGQANRWITVCRTCGRNQEVNA